MLNFRSNICRETEEVTPKVWKKKKTKKIVNMYVQCNVPTQYTCFIVLFSQNLVEIYYLYSRQVIVSVCTLRLLILSQYNMVNFEQSPSPPLNLCIRTCPIYLGPIKIQECQRLVSTREREGGAAGNVATKFFLII